MPNYPAVPPEEIAGEVELNLIENEPPDLFPEDQRSYWGQVRKVHADALQILADQLSQWWLNLDPRTCSIDDLGEWEEQLGIPVGAGNRTTQTRRALIRSRMVKGPFTRTRRLKLVELIVMATFGADQKFTPDGIMFPTDGSGLQFSPRPPELNAAGLPLSAGGVPFTAAGLDLSVDFYVEEDISHFSYNVFCRDVLGVDTTLLQRELEHITTGGITFTITVGP